MRVLVNSCFRELTRIGVRGRRKSCAARSQEEGRQAVSMKIAIKDSKMCNIPAMRKRFKADPSRGVDEIKSFGFYPN